MNFLNLFFLKTYHTMGGIKAVNLTGVVIQIDGTIKFAGDIDAWPRYVNGDVLEVAKHKLSILSTLRMTLLKVYSIR